MKERTGIQLPRLIGRGMVNHVFEKPHADFDSGSWEAANPQSVLDFTASGYFFAVKLYERYGVPIGLINVSLGGAPVEAFMSAETLAPFPASVEAAAEGQSSRWRKRIRQYGKSGAGTCGSSDQCALFRK